MVRQCYFAVAGPDLSGPLEQSIAATPSWSSSYTNWVYRKPIPVAGSASWSGAQTNYQVPVNPSVEEVFDKTGLVGDWNFDEGGGTAASDKSGSGNHGTVSSTSAWTSSGKFGNAFSGNGSSYYTDAGVNSSLDLGTGSATIEVWFKTSQATGAMVTKRTGNGFQVYVLSSKLYADGAGTAGVYSSMTLTDNAWHHGAVVYDRSGSLLRLYVDGVANNTTALGATTLTDTANLNIGRKLLSGAGDYFTGSIDEVKIWNRALTADEVYKHYVGYTNTALVGSWHFSEGSGTNAADSSGQGNNGTMNGSSYWTSSGKFGNAFQG